MKCERCGYECKNCGGQQDCSDGHAHQEFTAAENAKVLQQLERYEYERRYTMGWWGHSY